jgi:hypothetical protein
MTPQIACWPIDLIKAGEYCKLSADRSTSSKQVNIAKLSADQGHSDALLLLLSCSAGFHRRSVSNRRSAPLSNKQIQPMFTRKTIPQSQ